MQSSPIPSRPARRHRLADLAQGIALVGIVLAAALLFLGRAWLVDAIVGTYTGCHGCFVAPALGADAWLWAGLLGLMALLALSRRRLLRGLLILLAFALLAIAAADLVIFDLLNQRLHLGDIGRFGGEFAANWSVLEANLHAPWGWLKLAGALLLLALPVLASVSARPRPRMARIFGVLALCSAVAALVIHLRDPVHYVHAVLIDNVLTVNLPQTSVRPFSAGFLDTQRTLAAAVPQQCERNAQPQRPSVIVVLVESLSSWQSRLLGGAVDWTPRLDAIARDNHYFTRFYANGFTTSGAEVAIGSGQLPIYPPGVLEYTFDHFAERRGSLPGLATANGYESAFFTPGDTGFLDLGRWLRQIGFDTISGADDPWYAGRERWQFNSVEDSVFYQRFLDWLDHRDTAKPFVSVLLTVSSHPPFLDPRSHKVDPERSFRYVDEQIGVFHEALRQRGFLDHGVLIVMGDHRTMTPLHEDEFAAHGERAYARVPMVVSGKVEMPAVVEDAFQQTDLLPSLAWQFGAEHCRSAYSGNFLRSDPQAPAIVVHARGDDRNRIDIYEDDSVSGFLLDGDESRWLGEAPADAEHIAAWINVQRAEAAARGLRVRQAGKR